MLLAKLGVCMCGVFSALAYAQQEMVGTFDGSYFVSGANHPMRYSVTLTITGVEDGKVAGKFNIDASVCSGDYPIQGTYQDNKLNLRTGDGSMRGCGQDAIEMVLKGNQLVGKIAGFNAILGRK
jgi:hypothetical protein